MVSAVNSTSSGSGSSPFSTATTNDVNREDFLRLLIAQLQHQDPLNPVENQEFVAQLATFSSLEQETNQTNLLQKLVDNQNGTATSQALSLIGKDVTVAADRFLYQPGESTEFVFNAPGSGAYPVQIVTDSGQVVMTDTAYSTAAGQSGYEFTGRGPNGEQLPAGIYNIVIGGTVNNDGDKESLDTYMRGSVEGVNFQQGVPVLIVNGQPVEMSQISAVFDRG